MRTITESELKRLLNDLSSTSRFVRIRWTREETVIFNPATKYSATVENVFLYRMTRIQAKEFLEHRVLESM